MGFSSVYNENMTRIHHNLNILHKIILLFIRKIFKYPTIFSYKEAIKYLITEEDYSETTIPVIVPNWDHSPRSGANGFIFKNAEPRFFKDLVKKSLIAVQSKPNDKKIILIKSWNEWGEGNHLEPDLKYGLGYLKAIKEAMEENE